MTRLVQSSLSIAIYLLASLIGVVAFLYPFFLPVLPAATMNSAHSNDAPLVLSIVVVLCFIALLVEIQGQQLSAKSVALLGVLVAINSLLRFIEVAVPGPGGFSPIFCLIILVGYIYGGRFGFMMGTLTLFVSALITGGVGPWLPYQMFSAGWAGMSAPLCRPLVRLLRAEGKQAELWLLMLFGFLWGMLYGIIMNLWFWPFVSGPADQYWQYGISLWAGIQRYLAFYLATSLLWDIAAACGNALLIAVVGLPTLRALRRFQARFHFHYEPLV
jgi:Protein of unknown function (DUF1393).